MILHILDLMEGGEEHKMMGTGFYDNNYIDESTLRKGFNSSNNNNLNTDAMIRRHKSSTFTSYLAKFGNWSDTSMAAATREKVRSEVVDLRRQRSMNRVNSYFNLEAKKVEKLQRMIAKRQHKMAYGAMEQYAALKLQTAFRSRRARKELKAKKLIRMMTSWMVFRMRLKKRFKAAKVIVRRAKKYVVSRRAYLIKQESEAAIRIAKLYKDSMAVKEATRVAQTKRRSRITYGIVLSTALTLSTSKINAELDRRRKENAKQILKRMLRIYVRSMRWKKMNRPRGKWFLHYLTYEVLHQDTNIESNFIIDHLKLLIEENNNQGGKDNKGRRKTINKKDNKKSKDNSRKNTKGGNNNKNKVEHTRCHLPEYARGIFATICFAETVELYMDLKKLCLAKEELLDGLDPTVGQSMKGELPVFRKKKQRGRTGISHSNTSSPTSIKSKIQTSSPVSSSPVPQIDKILLPVSEFPVVPPIQPMNSKHGSGAMKDRPGRTIVKVPPKRVDI